MMKHQKDILVVGSGLSAYGACCALIKSPLLRIYIFDIGLSGSKPGDFNHEVPNSKSIDGSYFPYGINDSSSPLHISSKRICSSHAKGGFASVYSGSILAPQDQDLAAWPVESKPSSEDYLEIANTLEILRSDDKFESQFLLVPDKHQVNRLKKKTFIGSSRIALDSNPDIRKKSPFNPFTVIKQWIKACLVTYQSDIYVCRLIQLDDSVIVQYEHNNRMYEKTFDYVMLGAGCVNTTAIVHQSLYGTKTRKYTLASAPIMLQSYIKILPFGLLSLFSSQRKFFSRDLCLAFVEHCVGGKTLSWSHTQLNYLNSTIVNALSTIMPRGFVFIISLLEKIIFFSITVFHSDLGPTSSITCKSFLPKEGYRTGVKVVIDEPLFRCPARLMRDINFGLLSKFFSLFLIPLPFSRMLADIMRKNQLGGWHFGGTLPMKTSPQQLHHCHPNGALSGLMNVRIIDSASFPSIPGSSIAYLTMANSYKISRKLCKQIMETIK